jgi:hypothetical protein
LDEILAGSSSKIKDFLVSSIKLVREPLCAIIRITALFMRVAEAKVKPNTAACMGRCLTFMNSFMAQLASTLIKALDTIDKGVKKEGVLR